MPDLSVTGPDSPVLDDRIRGFPPGHAPLPLDAVGRQGRKPYDGAMALPPIVTAGGSVFFDRVVAGLSAAVAADPDSLHLPRPARDPLWPCPRPHGHGGLSHQLRLTLPRRKENTP